MEVRTCKQCKRLFNYLSGPTLCPSCKDKLEDKFIQVRDYIRENPHEGINEVAKENDVSTNQIRRWIREERLAFSDDSDIGIDCEKCGRMIKSGRYCKFCKDEMVGQMKGLYGTDNSVVAKKHREAARMRFLDKEQ